MNLHERPQTQYEVDNLLRMRDVTRRQRDNLIQALRAAVESAPLFHSYAVQAGGTYRIGADTPHAEDCAACRWERETLAALEGATKI